MSVGVCELHNGDKIMKTSVLLGLCVLAMGISLCIAEPESQKSKSDNTNKNKDLAHSLLGAWVLVGEPGKAPKPEWGQRMKFWGEKNWIITEADPKTGIVIYHHGGTYTLDGDNYVETFTFANDNTKKWIGRQLQFKIKVDGDTFTQFGQGGNDFTEIWKRITR